MICIKLRKWIGAIAVLAIFQADAGIEKYFKKVEGKEGNHTLPGIDFIYMVNLDKRPEKYENTMNQLIPYGINPYRFSAINGWELSTEVLLDLGLKLKDSKSSGLMATAIRSIEGMEAWNHEPMMDPDATYFCHCLPKGAIGCALSHLSILQDAYDSGYKTIWVIEDDIDVIKDPKILSDMIARLDQQVPQWDIFYTDVDTKNQQGERVPCRAIAARPNFSPPPLKMFFKKNYKIDDEFSSTGLRYGTYSYIIRREGMKKILDFWKKYKIFLPIDIDLCFVPKLKMICANEDIISTIPRSPSDNGSPQYKKDF